MKMLEKLFDRAWYIKPTLALEIKMKPRQANVNWRILLALVGLLVSCSSGVKKERVSDSVRAGTQLPAPPAKPASKQATSDPDSLLRSRTHEILTTIKGRDFNHLSQYIHPDVGIRFSPYAHIDTATNVRLSREKFLAVITDLKKITWGNYDGSGEPISLTLPDYFNKFVYNADFLRPEKFSINKVVPQGNVQSNVEDVYKGCSYTESYFSGFDKKYEGMDWCALRLIFKRDGGKLYLVGIVHAQWGV